MKTQIFFSVIIFTLFIVSSCDTSFTDKGFSGESSSGKGGSLARFAIVGDKLYALTQNSIKYFDISEPAVPVYVDSTKAENDIETLFPFNNYLLIGTQSGMLIYDISFSGRPVFRSRYNHIRSCDPVVAEGNYAYVTLNSNNVWCGRNTNQLEIIDISDVNDPERIAEYSMQGPMGLGVDGNLLFVCDNGLKVYDISNKLNIELKQFFDIKATDVIPHNNLLLVIGDDGFYQYRYDGNEISLLSKISVEKEVTP
ncbi:MAG: hypothetical protein R6W78_15915 [Bacteroidales bacterium]